MFEAIARSLSQIVAPELRSILWKAIGLALILIVVVAVLLQRGLSWFIVWGGNAAEASLQGYHALLNTLVWIFSIATGLGIVVGAVFLMPAITSLIASVFVDDVADEVERKYYPAEEPGRALPIVRATVEGVRTALFSVLVYLLALPFLLFAGIGFVIFFVATAWLLSREYFLLAAMRFRSPDEARAMRKHFSGQIFLAGLAIAAFVSIPIVNLATPLFAMALMVHIHKQLSGPRAELLEPARPISKPVSPASGTDR